MAELRFGDRGDFEDADRGFIARLDPGIVRSGDGRGVWDGDAYGFLSGTPGHGQPEPVAAEPVVRSPGPVWGDRGRLSGSGLDLSNMTLVEGD
jgi:alkyl sulfatase BDS1-like metallo-beta-lactamase superfamily hydrolase